LDSEIRGLARGAACGPDGPGGYFGIRKGEQSSAKGAN